ncbi:hypothetical protein BVRB_2g029780 [Beta vulgaris subsp. vulgaris]|nr:hypothetical protein BVRB_2g029780 [Beta vulgaris subsp. vulgaris]
MNNITTFSLLLFLISLSSLPSLSSSSSLNLTETVFDILDRYNLPRGLLPDAIDSYTFNPSNGRLVVRLRPTLCRFNRGQTLWRYLTRVNGRDVALNIDLSRDRMVVRTGSRLGTVAAALDPPFTSLRTITEFWRRDLVNAQGGTTDTLWLYPPTNYRIVHTAPFRQVMRCNPTTNMDVM